MSSGRDELNSEVEQVLRSLEQEAARLDTLPLLGVLTQNQSATSTFAALLDLGAAADQHSEPWHCPQARVRQPDQALPGRAAAHRELIRQRSALLDSSAQKIASVEQALAAGARGPNTAASRAKCA